MKIILTESQLNFLKEQQSKPLSKQERDALISKSVDDQLKQKFQTTDFNSLSRNDKIPKVLPQLKMDLETIRAPKGSRRKDYPDCITSENTYKLGKDSNGKYYAVPNPLIGKGYYFYPDGTVLGPDNKIHKYTCRADNGQRLPNPIIDGVDVVAQAWSSDPRNAPTEYEKREGQKAREFGDRFGKRILEPIHDFYLAHPVISTFAVSFIPIAGPYLSLALAADQTVDAWNNAKTDEEKALVALGAVAGLMFGLKLGVNATSSSFLNNVERATFKSISDKLTSNRANELTANEISVIEEMSKHNTEIKNLMKAQIEISNATTKYSDKSGALIFQEAPKLKGIIDEVQSSKAAYVQKYGEQAYNNLLVKYLYNNMNKESFINTLKGVKNPTIRVKPELGGGSDHRVFQSATNPNVVFKAEIRPGEVVKWYDTFKKYPNTFAKPLKMVKVKGSDGTLLNAVAIEKLNTGPFYKLWNDLTNVGNKLKNLNYGDRGLENVLKNLGNATNKKKWNDIIVTAKKEYPNLIQKIDEFNKVIDNLYKITPNPDIRQYNLGYDVNGTLKALDL